MAVKLRLTRMGAKKKPFYRIVAIDSAKPRDGKYIEQVGIYDPVANPPVVRIDKEKAEKWLSRGAQPTDTVRSLFEKDGIMKRKAYVETVDELKEDAIEVAVKANLTDE